MSVTENANCHVPASSAAVGGAAAWVDRYGRELFVYLARRTDRHAAEDLLAETFLAAHLNSGMYQPEKGSLRAWLYGIATNQVRRYWRAEKNRIAAVTRLASRAEAIAPSAEDASVDRIDAELHVAQLATALAELTDGERDVLLLTAWTDLDSNEIARALGTTPGTVRSRLFRARQRLMRSSAFVQIRRTS